MTGMRLRTRVVNPAQLRRRRLFPSTRKMLYPVGRCSRDNSFYPRKHDMREMNNVNDDFSPRKSDGEVFRAQHYSWWSRKEQRRHRRGTNVDKTNTRMGGHRSSPSRSEKPSRAGLVITFSNSVLGSDSDSNLFSTRRVELKASAPSQMTDTLTMEENDQIASADFTVDANNNVDCHCEAYSETCHCQQAYRCTSSERVQTCSLFNTPSRSESHEGYTHTQSQTDSDLNADCEEWMVEDFEAQWQAGLEDLKRMSPERYRFYCEEV